MKIAAHKSIDSSPQGAGDERPLELLYACHEKVRRFITLSERLSAHVAANGADAEAATAAESVLRYFEQALPLHHADEEADVFPALLALRDEALTHSIAELNAEHARLDAQWQTIAPWLRQIVAGTAATAPPGLAAFAAAYAQHIEREERDVFAALERLPEAVVHTIAARMRARRGA